MKKIISLFLTLVMLLSFSACVDNGDEGNTKNNTSAISNNTSLPINSVSTATTSTESSSTANGVDTGLTDKEFSIGKVNGQTYRNDFIGLEFIADNDWVFYDDSHIAELNNIVYDAVSDRMEELMKNSDVVYLMYSGNEAGANVNINMEKIPSYMKADSVNLGSIHKGIVPELKIAYENMGGTLIDYEVTNIVVDGRNVDAMTVSAVINDISMEQLLFAKVCNNYIVNVAITGFSKDEVQDILNNFKWID